jgi:hypothetical protein
MGHRDGMGGSLMDDTNEMNGFDDHTWFTDGKLGMGGRYKMHFTKWIRRFEMCLWSLYFQAD